MLNKYQKYNTMDLETIELNIYNLEETQSPIFVLSNIVCCPIVKEIYDLKYKLYDDKTVLCIISGDTQIRKNYNDIGIHSSCIFKRASKHFITRYIVSNQTLFVVDESGNPPIDIKLGVLEEIRDSCVRNKCSSIFIFSNDKPHTTIIPFIQVENCIIIISKYSNPYVIDYIHKNLDLNLEDFKKLLRRIDESNECLAVVVESNKYTLKIIENNKM
jgi:hypothetical protein